jgi:hypothetical protein
MPGDEPHSLDVNCSAILTDMAMCLAYYRSYSPGLYCCIHAPVQLDDSTRLTPGVVLMVNYGKHKQCSVDPSQQFFVGPPNFVLDVFADGEHAVYEQRRGCFERTKVLEYVALWEDDPLRCSWNRLVNGQFTLVEADDPGMIRSTALPGLWIGTQDLAERNWWAIMGSIRQGVTRLGHHDLMESIWRKS